MTRFMTGRRARRNGSFLLMAMLALASSANAAASGYGSRIERVIDAGSGSFHCAWHRKPVQGLCKVSHERVRTRDPELVGLFGNGKPTATLDAIVIRWPSGRITRLVETDSWEWYVVGQPLQGGFHSAMKSDVTDVDWSRGFVILDDHFVEAIRVW